MHGERECSNFIDLYAETASFWRWGTSCGPTEGSRSADLGPEVLGPTAPRVCVCVCVGSGVGVRGSYLHSGLGLCKPRALCRVCGEGGGPVLRLGWPVAGGQGALGLWVWLSGELHGEGAAAPMLSPEHAS